VYGGPGADRIGGDLGHDRIRAGAGNDTVWLPPSDGVDRLRCGAGFDTVIYNLERDHTDVIAADCEDVLVLS